MRLRWWLMGGACAAGALYLATRDSPDPADLAESIVVPRPPDRIIVTPAGPPIDPAVGAAYRLGYHDGLNQVRYIRAPYPDPGPAADAYARGFAVGSAAAAEPANTRGNK